jgi:hypothetical protein
MYPATVKKAYGLILPNRLRKPIIISHIEISNIRKHERMHGIT